MALLEVDGLRVEFATQDGALAAVRGVDFSSASPGRERARPSWR